MERREIRKDRGLNKTVTHWVTHNTKLSDTIQLGIECVVVDAVNEVVAVMEEGAIIVSFSIEARV